MKLSEIYVDKILNSIGLFPNVLCLSGNGWKMDPFVT